MRTHLEALRNLSDLMSATMYGIHIKDAIAELEYLRGAPVGADVGSVAAENERLRAALKKAVDAINAPPSGYNTYRVSADMDNEERDALYACAKAIREAEPLVRPKPAPAELPETVHTRTGQTLYLCDDGGYRPRPSTWRAPVGADVGSSAPAE